MARRPVQDFFLFLLGSALFAAGIVLFTNQVSVGSGFLGMGWGYGRGRSWGGWFGAGQGQGFGLLMLPLGTGLALLLADSLRRVGWLLVWASSAAIGVLVLQSLTFQFRPASLWSLITMVAMVGGGAGLMFRSLRGYDERDRPAPAPPADPEVPDLREVRELREELARLRQRLDDRDS